jgi:hypothetical protein
MPGDRSDFDRDWEEKYERHFEIPDYDQRVDLPDWKETDPYPAGDWGRTDWNTGYDEPKYQQPYESTDFRQPNYVAEEDWW